MKRIVPIIVILFFLSSNTYSQNQDSHSAAVVELVNLIDMDALLSETINSLLNAQVQQNPSMGKYKSAMTKFFNKYMSWKSLENEFIDLYKGEFTEDEIRDLIVFYKTDTGKKAIKSMPSIMQKGAAIGQRRVQENIAELQEMIKEVDSQ